MDAEQRAVRIGSNDALDTSLPIRSGEALVVPERLSLTEDDRRRLGDAHPEERLAALVAWSRARGGLPDAGGWLHGTVASVVGDRPDGLRRGSPVRAPLAGAPLVLADISGWDGDSSEVPVADGYAILPRDLLVGSAP